MIRIDCLQEYWVEGYEYCRKVWLSLTEPWRLSGGSRFESQPEYRLWWLTIFVSFPSPLRQIPGQYLKFRNIISNIIPQISWQYLLVRDSIWYSELVPQIAWQYLIFHSLLTTIFFSNRIECVPLLRGCVPFRREYVPWIFYCLQIYLHEINERYLWQKVI